MIGYKSFDELMTGRGGMRFRPYKTYEHNGPLIVGKAGFHFCDVPFNIMQYYTGVFAKVRAIGDIMTNNKGVYVTNKLEILNILTYAELLEECGDTIFIGPDNAYVYCFKNSKFHRDDDLPAVILPDGTKEWYVDGNRHRDNDLPAVIWPSGKKEWYMNGARHRIADKPAIEDSDGTLVWFRNGVQMRLITSRPSCISPQLTIWTDKLGQLHRDDDLPAIDYANGDKEWYFKGKPHRNNDLPSVTTHKGDKMWHLFGASVRTRELPTFIDYKGTKMWQHANGRLHNDLDRPAVIRLDGTTEWWVNGRLHREQGPAIIHPDGTQEYYIDGVVQLYDGSECEYIDDVIDPLLEWGTRPPPPKKPPAPCGGRNNWVIK